MQLLLLTVKILHVTKNYRLAKQYTKSIKLFAISRPFVFITPSSEFSLFFILVPIRKVEIVLSKIS